MKQNYNNFALDFEGDRGEVPMRECRRIDVSGIEGTHLFCSEKAADRLSGILQKEGIRGMHLLDSGDFHYVSRLTTDLVQEPFRLVLIDHHTDMQESSVPGALSCGNWAAEALRHNKNLKSCILIGPPKEQMEKIPEDIRDKVLSISQEEIEGCGVQDLFSSIPGDLPYYVSIDKDALDTRYCLTDWDQGDLTVNQICTILQELPKRNTVIGIDICGNFPEHSKDVHRIMEAQRVNARSTRMICDFIARSFAGKKAA